MPKVSVIIPNYNHAPYLKERIDSVLNQTFTDFELIILDDCSSDDSREIIESYRSHRNMGQIIYNKTNSGSTFKQWKKGIDVAQGQWIWIAESDDVSDQTFLEKAMACATENTGLVFSNLAIIDEFSMVKDPQVYTRFTAGPQNGNHFIRSYFKGINPIINGSSVIFSKEKFLETGWNPTSQKLSADVTLWISLIYNSNICFLDESLTFYRKHSNSVTSKRNDYKQNFKEGIQNHTFLKSFLPKELLNSIEDGWVFQCIKILRNEHNLQFALTFYSWFQFAKIGKGTLFFKSCLKRK